MPELTNQHVAVNVKWTELDEFSDSVEESLCAHIANVDETYGL